MPTRQTLKENRLPTEPEPSDSITPVRPSSLAVMTLLGAADGTILLLAAQGTLSHWTGAVTVGLTVIAGAGAWITARQAFGGDRYAKDYAVLGAIALASSLATVLAATAGAWLGGRFDFVLLPRAIGVILLLIAADVGGIRLPRAAGAPLPVAAIAAAVVLEGWLQWTH